MRKKTDPIVLTDVPFHDFTHEGKGVGRADELVVFAGGAVPGDVADISIYKKKKNLAEGQLKSLKKASDLREDPFCQHFSVCGGCKFQHISYAAQLQFKQKQVNDAMERIGKLSGQLILPILGAPETRHYRNKLEFTFSNNRWKIFVDDVKNEEPSDALGFHVPLRFDKIVHIDRCFLQDDLSNAIRNSLFEFAQQENLSFYNLKEHEGLLRNLVVRNTGTGQWMLTVVFAQPDEGAISKTMDFLAERFPEISSLLYCINKKKNDTLYDQEILCWKGNPYIEEVFHQDTEHEVRYRIGPKSFFQTNSTQAENLYRITRDFAELTGKELVYDLYTGTGTIANYVAPFAQKVVGVEYVPEAIDDAHINAELNNNKNTLFFAGDMKDVLNDEFIQAHGRPEVVITDPPRAGMHADVVTTLKRLAAPRIVYVSCNPATQARDIELLSELYEVIKVQPVDMFPHTQHVESVALLQLKK